MSKTRILITAVFGFIVLVAVNIAAAFSPIAQTATPAPGFETYISPSGALVVDIPEGWIVEDITGAVGAQFNFYSSQAVLDRLRNQPNGIIAALDLDTGEYTGAVFLLPLLQEVFEYFNFISDALASQLELEAVEPEPYQLGANSGVIVELSKDNLEFLLIGLEYETYFVIYLGGASSGEGDELLRIMEQMAASLQWTASTIMTTPTVMPTPTLVPTPTWEAITAPDEAFKPETYISPNETLTMDIPEGWITEVEAELDTVVTMSITSREDLSAENIRSGDYGVTITIVPGQTGRDIFTNITDESLGNVESLELNGYPAAILRSESEGDYDGLVLFLLHTDEPGYTILLSGIASLGEGDLLLSIMQQIAVSIEWTPE